MGVTVANITLGAFEPVVEAFALGGVYGFVLPAVLIFCLVYAILLKTKVLGENQYIIGTVALAVSFLALALNSILGKAFVFASGIGAIVIFILFLLKLMQALW